VVFFRDVTDRPLNSASGKKTPEENRMDSSLQSIPAREFPDSRSNPAIEGEIMIRDTVRAVDPSGASTGKNQAVGFRDRLS